MYHPLEVFWCCWVLAGWCWKRHLGVKIGQCSERCGVGISSARVRCHGTGDIHFPCRHRHNWGARLHCGLGGPNRGREGWGQSPWRENPGRRRRWRTRACLRCNSGGDGGRWWQWDRMCWWYLMLSMSPCRTVASIRRTPSAGIGKSQWGDQGLRGGPESRSSSRWDSHFHSYMLTIYVRVYWLWELVVFYSLVRRGYIRKVTVQLVQNFFHEFGVLIVFHAANEKTGRKED